MNAKQRISIVALIAIALAVGYWTGCLHGSGSPAPHEMITSLALPIILIWTLSKLTLGLLFNHCDVSPPNGDSQPPTGCAHAKAAGSSPADLL